MPNGEDSIAEGNRDAADRVEMEIVATCRRLAKHPRWEPSGRT
jgi:plasmid stabilization system protein ParE